ncbi:hypothetical protein [Streptomyces sp. NPDC059491]
MDTSTHLRTDGDPTAAAEMAAGVLERLPAPYRECIGGISPIIGSLVRS